MKKITATIITIALVALGAVFVLGQTETTDKPEWKGKRGFGKHSNGRSFHGRRGKKGQMMGRMFRQLDLTDAQKEQMKTIRTTSRENMKPIREQMRVNKKQLNELTAGGNFNEADVQALASQQGALTAQMIVAKERTKAAMFAVLTDVQKSTLATKMEAFKAKRAERKQNRAERKAAWKAKKAGTDKSN
jgi:protein CpxP